MQLSITVNIQYDIRRSSVLLAGIGNASRIHRNHIIIQIDKRPMGMPEKYNVTAMFPGNLFQAHRIKAHAISVAVSHKYFMMTYNDNLLCRHRRKKIIITADHMLSLIHI